MKCVALLNYCVCFVLQNRRRTSVPRASVASAAPGSCCSTPRTTTGCGSTCRTAAAIGRSAPEQPAIRRRPTTRNARRRCRLTRPLPPTITTSSCSNNITWPSARRLLLLWPLRWPTTNARSNRRHPDSACPARRRTRSLPWPRRPCRRPCNTSPSRYLITACLRLRPAVAPVAAGPVAAEACPATCRRPVHFPCCCPASASIRLTSCPPDWIRTCRSACCGCRWANGSTLSAALLSTPSRPATHRDRLVTTFSSAEA